MIRPRPSIGVRRTRAGCTMTYAVGLLEPGIRPAQESRRLAFAALRASWAAAVALLGLFVTFRYCVGIFRP